MYTYIYVCTYTYRRRGCSRTRGASTSSRASASFRYDCCTSVAPLLHLCCTSAPLRVLLVHMYLSRQWCDVTLAARRLVAWSSTIASNSSMRTHSFLQYYEDTHICSDASKACSVAWSSTARLNGRSTSSSSNCRRLVHRQSSKYRRVYMGPRQMTKAPIKIQNEIRKPSDLRESVPKP